MALNKKRIPGASAPIGRTAIADLKNPDTGKIGSQGFTRVGVEQLINHATGIEDYAKGRSLKETLDALRSDPWGMTKVDEFLERTPIETTELPDGPIWLQDGHHRAFLADQIGKKDLPSRTKGLNDSSNTPVAEPPAIGRDGTGEVNGYQIGPGVNLEGANLYGADLRGADLRGAYLSEANLGGAYLQDARLEKAWLWSAILMDAKLMRADLRRAKLVGAILSGADLTGADLTGATFIEADCTNARLIKSNLTGAHLDRCDFHGTNLTRATLDRATFRQCQMPGAILDGVNAIAGKFIDISLHVSLVPDSASNVNVNKALNISARGADFRDSILSYTNLKNFYNFIYTPKNGAVPEDPLSEFLYELGVPVAFCIHGILTPYIEYINEHIEDLEARIINLCGTKKLKSPAATIRRALDNSPDMADLILSDLDMTVSMCLNNVDIRLAY